VNPWMSRIRTRASSHARPEGLTFSDLLEV
jgi:hypothetical protein